jgi:hypothetical protein
MGVVLRSIGRFLTARKQRHKKNGRNKDIHPDRIQVASSLTGNIFPGEKARPDDEVLDCGKKLSIEMSEVFEKVSDQVADTFLRLDILLPAPGTIPFFHNGAAVQAIFFMTQMTAHKLFF